MAKRKFYVVWKGVKPGIYTSWEACKAQVHGFEDARYKSFSTVEEAEKAFSGEPWKYLNSRKAVFSTSTATHAETSEQFIAESIAVDAACSGNPGKMEYRGVFVADGSEIFHVGPLERGTNNIGEFLAIVHALALQRKKGTAYPIYSDSVNALKWIAQKRCNTKMVPTPQNRTIFELIARAEKWLKENPVILPLLKWETKQWGEIPADFGRK